MSEGRFPADLAVTIQDFRESRWEEVLARADREGYRAMWPVFTEAAREAIDEGRLSQGKVLWLIADVCSMMLAPESVNEPFKPILVMDGRRSAIAQDFSEADIALLAQAVDEVDDPWLKARLADLVWLRQTKREPRFALAAIDAYRSIPLDTQTWVRGGRECWARAIRLARLLKAGAGNRLGDIESAILKALDAATKQDGFLGCWLATLIESNGLGRAQSVVIAQRLEALACELEADDDIFRARQYFAAGAKWFKIAGDDSRAAWMTVREAEGWVREATLRASSENPSHMVAATFYENAIQVYRRVPRKLREAYGVDARLLQLHTLLGESGAVALGELCRVAGAEMNISELVENARKSTSGKTPVEALRALCTLYPGVDVKQCRRSALERLRDHPLQALLPVTVMSREGRVIAKRPGLSLSGTVSEADEDTVRAEMVHDHCILIGILVQGGIWPMLETMWLEHRLHEADFVNLAAQSPVVPPGRSRLFGKALYAGFDGDFSAALHMLVPQIEHFVRHHLKQSGTKTTILGPNGIENELGLSKLMELPDAERVFGEDLAFEIRALFCDAFGPNLRNELAHGLMDDAAVQSVNSVYAWWFGLRLIFNAYWVTTYRDSPDSSEGRQA